MEVFILLDSGKQSLHQLGPFLRIRTLLSDNRNQAVEQLASLIGLRIFLLAFAEFCGPEQIPAAGEFLLGPRHGAQQLAKILTVTQLAN